MKKYSNKILTAGILFAFCCLLFISLSVNTRASGPDYITSRSELMKALSGKDKTIYVGDIDFDENDSSITISRSVKIVGKKDSSVLKHAHFKVAGSELESELISISFENIIFDGAYEMPAGDPSLCASFADFHGDRSDKGGFDIRGFIDITFEKCTFKNYCKNYGAAMFLNYTDGNKDLGTRASLDISDCIFEENICERGVLWCNGKNTKLKISNTNFRENTSYTSIIVLGGIKGSIDDLIVQNTNHVVFAKKNSFPQGGGALALINSEAVIKNSVFHGNHAPYGGGLLITSSKATLANCIIRNNSADEYGGGLLLHSSEDAPVYITNCVIRNNNAPVEGAVYVLPADQIGAGIPTGTVEFSFCDFENNKSDDDEHLIFHPVMFENESTTVGHDGKIDFIACRIKDEKPSSLLKDGENYNIINSDKKGDAVPKKIITSVADSYYKGKISKMYAGYNEKAGKKTNGMSAGKKKALFIVLITLVLITLFGKIIYVLTIGRKKKKKALINPEKSIQSKIPEIKEPETQEVLLQRLASERALTGREIDVLREYMTGKTRTEIAEALFISESTVKNHISSIFSKLGVKSRKELQSLFTKNP